MRVLLDCSNCRIGGIIQSALSALRNAAATPVHEWAAVLTQQLAAQWVPSSDAVLGHLSVLESGTAPNWVHNRSVLRSLERRFAPDVVFTIGGPAYWVASAPHLVWFARGHMLYPEYARRMPYRERLLFAVQRPVHRALFARATALVVQTQTVRARVVRYLHIPESRVLCVPNTYSPQFRACLDATPLLGPTAPPEVLVPAAYYHHKNIDIVPDVAQRLESYGVDARFVLTVPREHAGWARVAKRACSLGVESRVTTVGAVPHAEIARHYRRAAAVFLPTLLESSTATYPESFAAGAPLVTSDLDFARELCGDGALFVDPFDPAAAAEAIARVLTDSELRQSLIERGRATLATNYVSPEEKWRRQLLALEAVAQGKPFPDELL